MPINEDITIINRLGLHARAASKLVATASRFESTIEIENNGQKADAKSIMSILMLAASKDTVLTLTISGQEAGAACDAIKSLINNRFDENE